MAAGVAPSAGIAQRAWRIGLKTKLVNFEFQNSNFSLVGAASGRDFSIFLPAFLIFH
jgi:hypothetical protein